MVIQWNIHQERIKDLISKGVDPVHARNDAISDDIDRDAIVKYALFLNELDTSVTGVSCMMLSHVSDEINRGKQKAYYVSRSTVDRIVSLVSTFFLTKLTVIVYRMFTQE